jgi:hypothetical protein
VLARQSALVGGGWQSVVQSPRLEVVATNQSQYRWSVKQLKLPPYAERSDLEKIRSQWKKLTGLHGRDEPSAAIVRAATAVELSVNLAIRAEFAAQAELSSATVDGILRKANGLRNKMQNLLSPLVIGRANAATIKKLSKTAEKINDARNEIVHGGYPSWDS